MKITYLEQERVFHLKTPEMSYAFGVAPDGRLLHLVSGPAPFAGRFPGLHNAGRASFAGRFRDLHNAGGRQSAKKAAAPGP